jgi:hypothetical protein
MNIDKYLVVSGMQGVHKLVATRSNGFLIEDRTAGKTRFVPSRNNMATPLATIGVYVDTNEGQDTIPLADVFQKMLDVVDTNPPAGPNSNSAEFRAYFTSVMPDHDQDRVHINDIKKCIKWFTYMHENGIFEAIKKEEAAAAESAEVPAVEAPAADVPVEESAEPVEKPTKKKKKD